MNVGDRVRYVGIVSYLRGKRGRVADIYGTGWMYVIFDGDRNRSVVREADCVKEQDHEATDLLPR